MNKEAKNLFAGSSALRRLGIRSALVLISTLLSVALLEGAVRVFLPTYNPKNRVFVFVNEEGIPLGPKNATIRQGTPKGDFDVLMTFNQYGLRDPKDFKGSTTNDVFALGDSFTMGWGVGEGQKFTDLLAAKLHRQVFNIANPENILGYKKLLEYVRRRGAQVQNLVIGICMENDLQDYRAGKTDADAYGPRVTRSFLRDPRAWLKRHSAACAAVSYSLQKVAFVRKGLEKLGLAEDMGRYVGRTTFSEAVLRSSVQAVTSIATNFNTVVLIIPSRGLWCGDRVEAEREMHAQFVNGLREAGLDVVDMRAPFEASGAPLGYYFKLDPHWTPQGHELAAEELYRFYQTHPQKLTISTMTTTGSR